MAGNVCLKVFLIREFVVKSFIERKWFSAFILFSTSLLPYWSTSPVVSVFRAFFLILAPQLWQGASRWLTQPVVFLLVNCVILSIWVSTARQTDRNAVSSSQEKGKALSVSPVAADPPDQTCKLPSRCLRSSEVSPVPNSLQLPLISNAHDKKVDVPSCDSSQANDQEELGLRAEWRLKIDAISKGNERIERVKRLTSAPEKRGRSSKSKVISRVHSDSRASAAASSAAQNTEEVGVKICDKTCSSFPQNSSSVIVRDMSESEGMLEAMVIDRDELNERIDAFFTRFRRQLQLQKQESIRRRDPRYYSWGY